MSLVVCEDATLPFRSNGLFRSRHSKAQQFKKRTVVQILGPGSLPAAALVRLGVDAAIRLPPSAATASED